MLLLPLLRLVFQMRQHRQADGDAVAGLLGGVWRLLARHSPQERAHALPAAPVSHTRAEIQAEDHRQVHAFEDRVCVALAHVDSLTSAFWALRRGGRFRLCFFLHCGSPDGSIG